MTVDPKSILAFRNGSIGNTIAAIPALRALRDRYPSARLSVVVDGTGYELLEKCPWIDRLIIYEKNMAGCSLRKHVGTVRAMRATKPTHAVLFKRFFRNGLLARLSGARIRAGFVTAGKAPFLNLTTPYEEGVPAAELNLRLAALLDARSESATPELFLDAADYAHADGLLAEHELVPGIFCVAHYGGTSTPPDFLTPDRFAEVLRRIIPSETPIVITGYGRREFLWRRDIALKIANFRALYDLPLRVTAALMNRAGLFIGFNSGPAHLAAASGIPALVIFRPEPRVHTEIRKWLPVSPAARALIPPAAPDADAWTDFITAARRTAADIAPLMIRD